MGWRDRANLIRDVGAADALQVLALAGFSSAHIKIDCSLRLEELLGAICSYGALTSAG